MHGSQSRPFARFCIPLTVIAYAIIGVFFCLTFSGCGNVQLDSNGTAQKLSLSDTVDAIVATDNKSSDSPAQQAAAVVPTTNAETPDSEVTPTTQTVRTASLAGTPNLNHLARLIDLDTPASASSGSYSEPGYVGGITLPVTDEGGYINEPPEPVPAPDPIEGVQPPIYDGDLYPVHVFPNGVILWSDGSIYRFNDGSVLMKLPGRIIRPNGTVILLPERDLTQFVSHIDPDDGSFVIGRDMDGFGYGPITRINLDGTIVSDNYVITPDDHVTYANGSELQLQPREVLYDDGNVTPADQYDYYRPDVMPNPVGPANPKPPLGTEPYVVWTYPNGLELMSDNTIATLADGSRVTIQGEVIRPNGTRFEFSVNPLDPMDNIITASDGSIIIKGYGDYPVAKINSDGSLWGLHSGCISVGDELVYEDGRRVTIPAGSSTYEYGYVTLPSGITLCPDGTAILEDGTIAPDWTDIPTGVEGEELQWSEPPAINYPLPHPSEPELDPVPEKGDEMELYFPDKAESMDDVNAETDPNAGIALCDLDEETISVADSIAESDTTKGESFGADEIAENEASEADTDEADATATNFADSVDTVDAITTDTTEAEPDSASPEVVETSTQVAETSTADLVLAGETPIVSDIEL